MSKIYRRIANAWPLVALVATLAVAGCEKKEGLRITGIEPKNGPYTGGTVVTVHGSGFQEGGVKGLKVYFGEKEASRVYIEGDDKIKVEPPPGEVDQTVDLMFLFDDARKLEYPKAYTYEDFSQNTTTTAPPAAAAPPATPEGAAAAPAPSEAAAAKPE